MEDRQWTYEPEIPGSDFITDPMNTSSTSLQVPLTGVSPNPSSGNGLCPPPDLHFEDFGDWDQQQPLNGFYDWNQPQVQGAYPTSPMSFASNVSAVAEDYTGVEDYTGDPFGEVSRDTYSCSPYPASHSSSGWPVETEDQHLKYEPVPTPEAAPSTSSRIEATSKRATTKLSTTGSTRRRPGRPKKNAVTLPRQKRPRRMPPARTIGNIGDTEGTEGNDTIKTSIIDSNGVEGWHGTRFTVECSAGDACEYRSKHSTYYVSKDPHKQSQSRTILVQQNPEGKKSRVPAPFYAIVDGYRCANKILDSHSELNPTEIGYICVGCLDKPCTHVVGSYHSLETTEPTSCKHEPHLKRQAKKAEKAAMVADDVDSLQTSLPLQGADHPTNYVQLNLEDANHDGFSCFAPGVDESMFS